MELICLCSFLSVTVKSKKCKTNFKSVSLLTKNKNIEFYKRNKKCFVMQGYINVVRLHYWHYITLYKIRKSKNLRKYYCSHSLVVELKQSLLQFTAPSWTFEINVKEKNMKHYFNIQESSLEFWTLEFETSIGNGNLLTNEILSSLQRWHWELKLSN
jgi:hypothetical protein